MEKRQTMSVKHYFITLFSFLILSACSSNPADDTSNQASDSSYQTQPADTSYSQSRAKEARFYFDFLELGFDLDSNWYRANEEKELAVKKLFYNLNHSKLAIDVIGVFENDESSYLAISTSNIKNEWIFDEVKANEYFMNRVNRRFEGEVRGLRYVAFNIQFEGGQWVRAFIHNAPLRNFELDLVSTNPSTDLNKEITRVIQTIEK